jgi:hypothetical protein
VSILAPVMPPQSMILSAINMTFVTLAMETWETGGCPIASFDVDLQVMGDNVWKNVQRNISPNVVCIHGDQLTLFLFFILLELSFCYFVFLWADLSFVDCHSLH